MYLSSISIFSSLSLHLLDLDTVCLPPPSEQLLIANAQFQNLHHTISGSVRRSLNKVKSVAKLCQGQAVIMINMYQFIRVSIVGNEYKVLRFFIHETYDKLFTLKRNLLYFIPRKRDFWYESIILLIDQDTVCCHTQP